MSESDSGAATDTNVVKKPKKTAKPSTHPKYSEMITAALTELKSRTGSSRQAIGKYIKTNYTVGDNVDVQLKLALKRMVASETIAHTKGIGASGSFKLQKPEVERVVKSKPPAKKKPVARKAMATKAKPKRSPVKRQKKTPVKKSKSTPRKAPTKSKKAIKKPAKKPVAKKPASKRTKASKAKPKGRKGRK